MQNKNSLCKSIKKKELNILNTTIDNLPIFKQDCGIQALLNYKCQY
jgi:hypothetical protein